MDASRADFRASFVSFFEKLALFNAGALALSINFLSSLKEHGITLKGAERTHDVLIGLFVGFCASGIVPIVFYFRGIFSSLRGSFRLSRSP